MIVIADSSPLRYIVLIQEVHLLPTLYGTIVLPPGVVAELTQKSSPNPSPHLDGTSSRMGHDKTTSFTLAGFLIRSRSRGAGGHCARRRTSGRCSLGR